MAGRERDPDILRAEAQELLKKAKKLKKRNLAHVGFQGRRQ